MKVYLSAPFITRERMVANAAELTRMGLEVVSRWINSSGPMMTGPASAAPDEQIATEAAEDFADIQRADVVVAFSGSAFTIHGPDAGKVSTLHSGGRHIEVGYALARNKPVIVVGEPENIFHRACCTVVPNWHEAVLELAHREHERLSRTASAE